jgi:hypothetical protein
MCPTILVGSAGTFLAGGAFVAPTAGLIGWGGSLGLTGSLLGSVGGSTIFSALSFGAQAFGAYRQGQFAQTQAEHQARIAEFNAKVAENDVIMARQSEQLDNDRTDDLKKRIAASAQTGFAKSGVVINIDTPLAIQERIATDAAEDRFNRTFVADQQVAAARVRAAGGRASATSLRITGQEAVTSSRLKATGAAFKLGESLLA